MFKTLLLAVDINDVQGAARSAQAAQNMAVAEGALLHILNVVPDSGMAIVGAAMSKDQTKQAMAAARAELEDWTAKTISPGIRTELHVTHGTVYDQILKLAKSVNADGIFVGAHRPELRDYLIGPNSARVARHAQQSVFVIR